MGPKWLKTGLANAIPALLLLTSGAVLFSSSGRDDAHITYWAAYAISHFGKIVNYSGEFVEQSSSLLQVLFLATINRLTGFNIVTLGKLSSIIFGSAILPLTYFLTRETKNARIGIYATLIICLSTPLVYWSFSGMESTLTALILLLTIFFLGKILSQKRSVGNLIWAFFWIFLLEISRPEMPVLVISALSSLSIFLLSFRSRREKFSIAGTAALLTVIAAAGFGLLAGFRWWYFHSFFPQPVIAKSSHIQLETIRQGINYFTNFLSNPGNFILAVLAAVGMGLTIFGFFRRDILNITLLLAGVILAGYTAFIIVSGGDWMEGGRFFVPIIPLAGIFAAMTLERFLKEKRLALLAIGAVMLIQFIGLIQFSHTFSTGVSLGTKTDLNVNNLDKFSTFELHNQVNLRDIPLYTFLDKTTQAIIAAKKDKVILLSGQMGFVPYHLAQKYFGQIMIIDRRGLADRRVTDCELTTNIPRSATGIKFTYAFFFDHLSDFESCQIPAPDIIFDIGSLKAAELSNDYVIAYQQQGQVNFQTLWQQAPLDASAFIIVRREYMKTLGLSGTASYDFNQGTR